MIYLDNAATTMIDKKVLRTMEPYLKIKYGNASSLYSFGEQSRQAIEKARKKIAGFFNCYKNEIIFTGSATQSDNMAILGVVRNAISNGIKKPHIITSNIEHSAVYNVYKFLEKQGIETSYVKVNKNGIVEEKDIERLIKQNTILISVIYANNEIGTIQPIARIGKLIKKINKTRKNKIYFHTDAVQAINYLNCNVKKLGVDLLTFSGHKIYGPKGIGGLFVKNDVIIEPIIFGGGQEKGISPGTENVANIVGLGKAVELVGDGSMEIRNKKIQKLRDKLIKEVLRDIPGARVNGSMELRLPNNANISFEGVEGEAVALYLDQNNICVSTGSACSAKNLSPSRVLMALSNDSEQAHSSVRFTLGKYTTEQDINETLRVLRKAIKKLRQISGYKI